MSFDHFLCFSGCSWWKLCTKSFYVYCLYRTGYGGLLWVDYLSSFNFSYENIIKIIKHKYAIV